VPERLVTLVLCTPSGELLGALPAVPVPSPEWRRVDDVVTAAREHFGVDVRVLRLLSSTGPPFPGGGPVSYLAETTDPPPVHLRPWPGDPPAEHPLRMHYARPGGHDADLSWAQDVLAARGTPTTGAPQQVRTWNLSSIWRLPTVTGAAWLKVVPPFFAHEGALLPLLDPTVVPPVLGAEPGRVLLAEVPGEDQYDATGQTLLDMVRLLVRLQAAWVGRTEGLIALGVPDLRPAALVPRITAVTERLRGELADDERRALDALVNGLPRRFGAIEACGVPDTLVHGDFHPGNLRGGAGRLVILDWGDSGIGHPMIDQLAFCRRLTPADRAAAVRVWAQEWSRIVPGSDATRSAALLKPVAALNAAVTYQRFLDTIEPAERPYHEGDPVRELGAALSAVR
jgi:hypothetical protein